MKEIIEGQKDFFHTGATREIHYRKKSLGRFYRSILKHEEALYAAMSADFGKSSFEAWSSEIGLVLGEIRNHIKHLSRWARPERVLTPSVHFPSTGKILKEPYGQVLIISPWNYPFLLAMMPLVGAVSAGNCVILKTAHYSEQTSRVMTDIVSDSFEPGHVHAFGGGREVNEQLLAFTYHYIFFTGSPGLGKIVMAKAAQDLTPLTLELGGKSPCIVTAKAHIPTAARRIVWGKFINAGQTCVAPDYLLVEESVKQQLVAEMIRNIKLFYGDSPQNSPDLARIINDRQWERVTGLIQGEKILFGGESDRKSRSIAPTLLDNPALDAPVMSEEIFGPVLPVLAWKTPDEVLRIVERNSHPLACYLFTRDPSERDFFLNQIPFGGGCVNDTVVHAASEGLPFGGVGNSGMGRYHGKESFLTFTHQKPILTKALFPDIPLRYPPYNEKKRQWVKKFIH